jgi:hypothetical protein
MSKQRNTPALSDIEKLPLDSIKLFRETGESKVIPYRLQRYILHLDKAIELFKFEGNISRASKMLMETFPEDIRTMATATKRVSDAINYFHLNTSVKNAAWDQYYADKFENLGRMAISQDNVTEARRNFEKAHYYRTLRNDEAEEGGEKQIVHVLSPDISLLNVVGSEFNLKKLWTDVDEFIANLPVDENQRRRVKNEAAENLGVEDVEYEDMSDE